MSRKDGHRHSQRKPPDGTATQIRSTERAREVQAGIPMGGEGNAPLTESELILFVSRQIRSKSTDPKLRQTYALKYGEYLRLWGPKASTRKPQQPVGFDIEGEDAANLP